MFSLMNRAARVLFERMFRQFGASVVVCLFLMQIARAETASKIPNEWNEPRSAITSTWRTRAQILSLGEDPFGRKELDKIVSLMGQYEIEALPEISLALLNESRSTAAGSGEAAKERIHYANRFSPDYTAIHYAYCRPSQVYATWTEAIDRCGKALVSDFNSFDGQLRWMANAFRIALTALITLSIVFALFLVMNYRKAVSHLWAHRWRGTGPTTTLSLATGAILVSFVCGGPISGALVLLLILWRYLAAGEKVIAILLLAVTAAIPFALYGPALYIRYEGGIARELSEPMDGITIARRGQIFRRHLQNDPNDSFALLELARIEKVAGRTANARALLEQASKISPNWHKPLVNLASLDYGESKSADAIAKLQRAASMAPGAFTPLFNLGRIYFKETRIDEGRSAHSRAKEADAAMFGTFEQKPAPTLSTKFIVEERLSRADLYPRVWGITPEIETLRKGLFADMFAPFTYVTFWILLGATVLLGFLSAWIFPLHRTPRVCEKCGQPSCSLCDPAVERESLCSQCYHTFVRLESIDPIARKTKDRQAARHRIWKDATGQWSTLLAPGAHRLFRGDYVRAIVFLAPAMVSLASALMGPRLLTDPSWFPGFATFPWTGISATIFFLFYGLGIWDAVKR